MIYVPEIYPEKNVKKLFTVQIREELNIMTG